MTIEEKIWTCGIAYIPTDEDLVEIGQYLVEELSNFLEEPIEVFREYIRRGHTISLLLRSLDQPQGLFRLRWESILGFQSYKDKEPEITLYLFLFSNNYRIGRLRERGNSYFTMMYRIVDGKGTWLVRGWVPDELREWAEFWQPRIEWYGKKERVIVDE